MKHWHAVPYADDLDAESQLHAWLYEHGWGVRSCTFEAYGPTCVPGPPRVFLTISPAWAPSWVEMTIMSGVTLVYDDRDRSMAVTLEPEPEDAVPDELEDAIPAGFVERHADASLLQDSRPRRRRR